MRIVMTLMTVALALGPTACKKKGGDAIAKMTEFKDQMCACKDKACADKVNEEYAKWAADAAKASGGGAQNMSADEAKKFSDVGLAYSECMTKLATAGMMGGSDTMAGSGGSGGSMAGGSGGSGGSMAGGSGGSGDTMAGGSGAAGDGMAHQAGNCPSTVLGATTKAELKGKDVVLTITSDDKDAIAAIQKRTEELLKEKSDAAAASGAHDQKGSVGGGKGKCPVFYGESGGSATSKTDPKGVVITITPKDKPEDLKKAIDERITKAAAWVKDNIKPGDQGNKGGVGGGKGDHGSTHSGQGDSKGKERKDGTGGGAGTGGGGGKGTGGGSGSGDKKDKP